MEKQTTLRLAPQATLVKQGTKTGVSCLDITVWAKDGLQAHLVQVLAERPRSIHELKQALIRERGGPKEDDYAALILADFILTFNDVIEDELGGF